LGDGIRAMEFGYGIWLWNLAMEFGYGIWAIEIGDGNRR